MPLPTATATATPSSNFEWEDRGRESSVLALMVSLGLEIGVESGLAVAVGTGNGFGVERRDAQLLANLRKPRRFPRPARAMTHVRLRGARPRAGDGRRRATACNRVHRLAGRLSAMLTGLTRG